MRASDPYAPPIRYRITDWAGIAKAEEAVDHGEPADTYGWDTVSAVRLPDVNAAIAELGVSPPTFEQTEPKGNLYGLGTFGTWQLTPGGDGTCVWMALPLPSGAISFEGQEYPWKDLEALIEVNPSSLSVGADSPPTPSGEDSVIVLDIRARGASPKAIVKALLKDVLERWLCANLWAPHQVLWVASLGSRAAKARTELGWLAPTSFGYAYGQAKPGTEAPVDDCVLAVLAMVEGRAHGDRHAVDPLIVPEGARAALVIPRELAAQHDPLPKVPGLFKGPPEPSPG